MSKKCPKCSRFLPLEMFYKRAASKDGLASYCKACTHEHQKNSKNRKLYRANYFINNREKSLAADKLRDAINDGTVIRPTKCQFCGKERKLRGHHEDYSLPLGVIWLCPSCHNGYHEAKRKKQ